MAAETKHLKNDQNLWNFFFAVFFAILLVAAMVVLFVVNGELPKEISIFDFSLIALASFRLTRLITREKITRFFRDFFLDMEEITAENGEVVVVRRKPLLGPRRTIAELLDCPWCFGIWSALLILFFFYLTELSWFVIVLLAIAGVGTFLQIITSLIGNRAELARREVGTE